MKRKQTAALLLSSALLLGLALPAQAVERPVLPDVPEDHWARPVLAEWQSYGVLAGDTDTGAIRPDDSLSRAELAALLDRIMGYPLLEIKHFNDVPADAWYAETMSRLNSAGVIQGDGNNQVRPQDPVTRQETAVILCRALGIPQEEADVDFLDKGDIAPWAAGAVGALYNRGAIHGWEGYFDPQAPITRCHVVTLLDNLIGAVMTRPGTWDRDVEGDLYICNKQALLTDFTVTGDLILSHGVDAGDVTLNNVTVQGDLILHGGGEHSVHIQSQCVFEGDIIIDKTVAGSLRLVNEMEEPLKPLRVDNVSPALILEGPMTTVDLYSPSQLSLQACTLEALTLHSPNSQVSVDKDSKVASLTIGEKAKGEKNDRASAPSITIGGEVTSLTAQAPARVEVEDTGTVASAHAAVSGLVLAGKRPAKITAATSAARPKDDNGKTFSITQIIGSSSNRGSSSSGGSSGGGSESGSGGSSGNDPGGSSGSDPGSGSGSDPGGNPGSGTDTPASQGDIRLTLAAPVFGEAPQDAEKEAAEGDYTLSTRWENEDGSPATYRFISDTFTAGHVYQAVITLTLTPDAPDQASPLYFGKPLSEVTVTLNGERVPSPTPDETAGTLTFTHLFPATEEKPFIEAPALSAQATELEPEGQAQVSLTFTDNGLLDPADYQYQWLLNGSPLEGASGSSYTVTAAAVSAAEGGYSLTCAVSAPGRDPVTAEPLSFTVKAEEPPQEPDPEGGGAQQE